LVKKTDKKFESHEFRLPFDSLNIQNSVRNVFVCSTRRGAVKSIRGFLYSDISHLLVSDRVFVLTCSLRVMAAILVVLTSFFVMAIFLEVLAEFLWTVSSLSILTGLLIILTGLLIILTGLLIVLFGYLTVMSGYLIVLSVFFVLSAFLRKLSGSVSVMFRLLNVLSSLLGILYSLLDVLPCLLWVRPRFLRELSLLQCLEGVSVFLVDWNDIFSHFRLISFLQRCSSAVVEGPQRVSVLPGVETVPVQELLRGHAHVILRPRVAAYCSLSSSPMFVS